MVGRGSIPCVGQRGMAGWAAKWSQRASGWEGAMSVQFSRLARWSAQRPRQVQWAVTTIMLISCIGYTGFHFEDRPEELWTLQDSELLQALHYMRTIPSWSDSQSRSLILVFESDSTDGQGNVLTSTFMDSAAALHKHLLSTTADDGTSFYDLCTPLPDTLGSVNGTMTSAPCFVYSFLEFWPPSIPCMDTPAEMLRGNLGAPFTLFTGCDSLSSIPAVMQRTLNCDTEVPISTLMGWSPPPPGATPAHPVVIADICPVTCGRCSADAPVSAAPDLDDPAVSSISIDRLLQDRRVLDALNATTGALGNLCADFPASLLSEGSRGFLADCADSLRQLASGQESIVDACSTSMSPEQILAGAEPATGGNPSCWDREYTFARCCEGGAPGDPSCWGGPHSYRSCCENGQVSKQDAERLSTYSAASFCPATCGACAGPADPLAEERALPLVLINGAQSILQWDPATLLGREQTDPASGALMKATAIRLIYSLNCPPEAEEKCLNLEDRWMQELGAGDAWPWPVNRAPDLTKNVRGDARARFFSLKGQNIEMLRAIFGTLPLLGLSGVLMSGYITLALGKVGSERRHSKVFVGMVGNCAVGISTVMTFGICCGLGVVITPISQVVPFLLLGIGVDDMFVIVRTFERMPLSLSTEDRIERTYRECGGAIAVTSATDALAFLVGATIKFPAMRAFCINAGVGVIITFILQLTFMAAALALTDRGIKGNPTDCDARCIRIRDKIEGPMVDDDNNSMDSALADSLARPPSSGMQALMEKTLSQFLAHGSDRAHKTVLAVFALMALGGMIGASQMQRGFPLTDVFCDDSYVSDFLRASSKHFPNQAYPFDVVFKDVNYDDSSQLQEMSRVKAELEALPEVVEAVSDWVVAYQNSVYFTEDRFVRGLRGFLSSPEGVRYAQDIVFKCDGCEEVAASRFIGLLPGDMNPDSPLASAEQQENMVTKLKDIMHGSSLEPKPFAFSFIMLVWEVWTELVLQMFINLGQAFVAIALCTAVFLLHPATSLIVTLK